ncbi:50S ribosomal protein L7/L12 [Candidatus Haliotispira prima]|uniref:Large ribosomal subunit protein bL12 n=1 Tax=Candidatus Haliotispira prima TaxID=3034016 RepID=A0ABY8MHE2_9SPIO|nr:50S ribosomal protein L7/L12 [Candidatus Haliotispira prima]
MTVENLVEEISKLTVLEVSELVKALEDKFGVSAAAPVAAVAAPAAGGAESAAEEQTEFDVILTGIDDSKKIALIKEVRAVTGLDLKGTKEFVENPGKPVKEGISKEEAAELKSKLEAAGAKIEVK